MAQLLKVSDLRVRFHGAAPDRFAVDGISFSMEDGEILGLVGESGSGKTVTAMSVCGLLPRHQCDVEGSITLSGRELLQCGVDELRDIQGDDMSVVFQEPMTSMNPVMRVGRQVEESLLVHGNLSAGERRECALQALEQVELPSPKEIYKKYPHELSGGMLQRVMIAAAIINKPKLLLADEPTTALDVTIQAQVLDLLRKMNIEHGMAILFISHNLNVVRNLCTNVAIMQRGKLVETGSVLDVFQKPQHEYTQRLIAAIPTRDRKMT